MILFGFRVDHRHLSLGTYQEADRPGTMAAIEFYCVIATVFKWKVHDIVKENILLAVNASMRWAMMDESMTDHILQ